MRRVGGLFEQVCTFRNLESAALAAQRGKRYRSEVLAFNFRREDELHELSRALSEECWRPSGHRHFLIREPKLRWISAAPYHDRVVHHAVCNMIEPVLDRQFIFDCWANRRGKGSHRAVLRYQRFANRSRYALKMDVRKYFPSIDHAILIDQLTRRFKDKQLLRLMTMIVEDVELPGNALVDYFPGDDLFTPYQRSRGLPIGNLTSQLWANVHLDNFDHWVKEQLHVPAYLRFVDDFILLSDEKEQLKDWRDAVEEQLASLRLKIHPRKSVIRRTSEGVPFLGYVVRPRQIRVRGETVRRFRRRMLRHIAESDDAAAVEQSMAAWRGHTQLAGTWRQSGGMR